MAQANQFNFKDLFVLDLANNHQGSVVHGKSIIESAAKIIAKHKVRAAIKFQFRDLPEFIHKDERTEPKNKHVPRFLSTRLEWSEFSELHQTVQGAGLISMCTPFDEVSVDKIVELGFDAIKVASCSATDWPLLEKIAATDLPLIASTGGLLESEVDDLVSFLRHRGCHFALMHCVSIYPTPDEACNLGNILGFKERYPGLTVGWSTHEPPSELVHVGLAAALGAEMFERHIGLETDSIKLNAYSSTPEQLDLWMSAFVRSRSLIGMRRRENVLPEEKDGVRGLMRGVFARDSIEPGKILDSKDVYFAFPYRDGQLPSGRWTEGITLNTKAVGDAPIAMNQIDVPHDHDEAVLKKSIHEVKALLAYARIALSHEFSTEYSHHYGVRNFRKVGAVLINVVNRDYAKKILVQLAGQEHPSHFHKLKEETFIVLWGELVSVLDGKEIILQPGDKLTVPPGVWHSFKTDVGCVFEEISTTAFSNDSVYRDVKINNLTSDQRKTKVDHWGRFQISKQLRGDPMS